MGYAQIRIPLRRHTGHPGLRMEPVQRRPGNMGSSAPRRDGHVDGPPPSPYRLPRCGIRRGTPMFRGARARLGVVPAG